MERIMLSDDYPIWKYDHSTNLTVENDIFTLNEKEYMIIASNYPYICLFDVSNNEFLIYNFETKFIYGKENCEFLSFPRNEKHQKEFDFRNMTCIMIFEVKINNGKLLYKILSYNDAESIKRLLCENLEKYLFI